VSPAGKHAFAADFSGRNGCPGGSDPAAEDPAGKYFPAFPFALNCLIVKLSSLEVRHVPRKRSGAAMSFADPKPGNFTGD
jgi:hypothetical protein